MSASVSDIQQRLEKLDPSDDSYLPLLRELLSHQGLRPHIQGLDEPGVEGFIESLDKTLDRIPVTDDLFRKALRRLRSVCSNRRVLPRSYIIQGGRLSNRGKAFASGGFADAHEAELDGKKVCIKALRSYVQDTAGVTKKAFYREVVVWKRLQHPNIVPFLGIPAEIPPFEIVCDWMDNDRITEYIRKNPEVDRIDLLWDVADGLHFLHSCNVTHGDLKAANILIDKGGHARLTGFGLASIIRGEFSVASPQDHTGTNATTWAAPEILRGDPVSKEGDVFTFGMVVVETFAGHPPFVVNSNTAIMEILNGKRPARPATLQHDGLWEIMKVCWSGTPSERPTAFKLLEFFQGSFPRKNDTPETQPLRSTSSTWSLADTEGPIDRNPGLHPEQPRRDALGGDESGPQGPSTGPIQADGCEPQVDPSNLNQLAPEDHARRTAPVVPPKHATSCVHQQKNHGLWCRTKRRALLCLLSGRWFRVEV